jgi:hypothetical protein
VGGRTQPGPKGGLAWICLDIPEKWLREVEIRPQLFSGDSNCPEGQIFRVKSGIVWLCPVSARKSVRAEIYSR